MKGSASLIERQPSTLLAKRLRGKDGRERDEKESEVMAEELICTFFEKFETMIVII